MQKYHRLPLHSNGRKHMTHHVLVFDILCNQYLIFIGHRFVHKDDVSICVFEKQRVEIREKELGCSNVPKVISSHTLKQVLLVKGFPIERYLIMEVIKRLRENFITYISLQSLSSLQRGEWVIKEGIKMNLQVWLFQILREVNLAYAFHMTVYYFEGDVSMVDHSISHSNLFKIS